ncbi:hypothetical protein LXL04_039903 [Taraxacum kok-saghyz]
MSTQPSASNSSIPATFSGQNLPPPPPGFPPRQNYTLNDEDPIQAVSENEMSPEQRQEGPIMMSNEDILSMLNTIKRQMAQQHRSHQTLIREIEGMRNEIRRPPVPAPSTLRPRILNFDASGSLNNHSGPIIPTTTITTEGVTPQAQVDTFQDPGEMFTSAGNLNAGNPSNNHTFFTNIADVDAAPIAETEIPKRFQTPSMKLYDGTTDPEEHIAQYRERMEIIPIPAHLKEACLCKGFGSTLTGSALKWLLSVIAYSITSFAHLVNLFNNQFSCSRAFEKITSDLYRVVQDLKESLRTYVSRFGKETLEIPNLDMATAVEAFKMGLKKDSPFYKDLVMTPCKKLDEVRSRAIRFIRLEEDKEIQRKSNAPTSYAHPNRKTDSSSSQRSFKAKPDTHWVNALEEDVEEEEFPKITDYCFSVDTSGLLYAMQDLGDKARWPRKVEKSSSWKDKSKWCAYHEDLGHITEECITLRKEVNYLLSKGQLKELLGRRKERSSDPHQDPSKIPERADPPPPNAQVINMISGGSDICGTSYSAAKRQARASKSEKIHDQRSITVITNKNEISFSEEDRADVQDPNHDGLLITLHIANLLDKRILIDGGSSANM